MADFGTTHFYGPAGGEVNRESVTDAIFNADPFDTPLYNLVSKVPARHTTEEWLEDTLAATSITGAKEGRVFTQDNLTRATRALNVTQIFGKDVIVSETQLAVSPYGFDNALMYELMKGTREVMRNIEAKIFSASGASSAGSGTVVSAVAGRDMKTLDDFISTNSEHPTATSIGGGGSDASAASVNEARFNGLLQKIFNSGGNPNFVFCGGAAKRRISSYTGVIASGATGITFNINATEQQVSKAVNTYISDFGLLNIVLDRWVPSGTDVSGSSNSSAETAGRIYFLEMPRVQLRILRPIKVKELASDGDRVRAQITGELTLALMNQAVHGRLKFVSGRA